MKNFFLATIIALASFSAFANEASLLNPQTIRNLPAVHVLNVTVDSGPRLAAVQPYAVVNFEFTSCSRQEFSAQTEVKDGILYVALDYPQMALDCMGPQITRQHTLQISSDFRHPVVILNPPVHLYVR